jgi:hypothetical protein
MSTQRLGDDIDDYCVKCKRITNHAVVSLMEDAAAKVRCQACYSEHDFRHEIAPPTKRELKKMAEAAQKLAEGDAGVDGVELELDAEADTQPEVSEA